MNARQSLLVASLAAAMAAGCVAPTRPDREALRRTALVEAFEACKDSVVSFTATRVENAQPPAKGKVTHTQWGSGCVLHEAGYVLSNSHMLRFEGNRTARLYDGKPYPVELIAADEANDLALLKIDAGRPLKALRLGRSRDLMVGEPAITIGNPFGIGFTMAAGIVSGVGRHVNTEFTHLVDVIQTDASINPGSSGGPLLNIFGELIGVCTSRKSEGENIGFAIAVDHVRAVLLALVAPEERYGFILGLKVTPGGAAAVSEVVPGSPAEAAGVQVGDLVTRVGGMPVGSDIDFTLALVGRKGGEALPLELRRNGQPVEATATLGTVEPRPAETPGALAGGLDFKAYQGDWKELPDFDQLKPSAAGTAPTFDLGTFKGKDLFGMKFTGYIDVPADGIYAFTTRSDDGSRLWIGDRLVVDNDGLHASAERRGFISLKAGKHLIAVAFFEGPGDEELKVLWEGSGLSRQEIPTSALFRPAPPAGK